MPPLKPSRRGSSSSKVSFAPNTSANKRPSLDSKLPTSIPNLSDRRRSSMDERIAPRLSRGRGRGRGHARTSGSRDDNVTFIGTSKGRSSPSIASRAASNPSRTPNVVKGEFKEENNRIFPEFPENMDLDMIDMGNQSSHLAPRELGRVPTRVEMKRLSDYCSSQVGQFSWKDRISLIQFPPYLPFEKGTQAFDSLPNGEVGTLEILKSGKMRLNFGSSMLDLETGVYYPFHEEVWVLNQSSCIRAGKINDRLVTSLHQ